jgi:hypothetical protein
MCTKLTIKMELVCILTAYITHDISYEQLLEDLNEYFPAKVLYAALGLQNLPKGEKGIEKVTDMINLLIDAPTVDEQYTRT